jgi:hypothetical protein
VVCVFNLNEIDLPYLQPSASGDGKQLLGHVATHDGCLRRLIRSGTASDAGPGW